MVNRATTKGKDTSPGRGGKGFQLFKQSGKLLFKKLLAVFNNVWGNGGLPKEWKRAMIIPVVKPGKEPKSSLYRPMALTSLICKTIE